MKAIQITQTGGPEVMSIREVPTPVLGSGEVLIQVAASQAHSDLASRVTTGKLLLIP